MIPIIINEWKILLRVRVLVYLTLVFVASLVLVTWLGVIQNQKQQNQKQSAHKQVREQWEKLDAMNPHGAAHYGSYAFKPVTPLSSIDEGVNAITGNVLRLEGHVQNEIVFSEASQSLSVSKFGKLKPSLLLQYCIPLLLIFLAFSSVSSEKETGRLKLLVFQGASLPNLILAKALSVWLYGFLLLTITVAVQTVINLKNTGAGNLERTLLLLVVYSAYYYIVCTLATYLSARLKNNTVVLTAILSVWILWTIFLPKLWGNTTDKIYPLPSRQVFNDAMQIDRSKGIDGHNPTDEREEKLKQKILAQYKVDSVEQLPINYDGLLMQEDEEYGNLVWDKHFGSNNDILQKQKNVYQFSGFFNPFASLQSTSMGFCGSDMLHHVDFLKQAELYRRDFIKKLNNKHAYGGSKTGNWKWKANNAFYKSVQDFEYKSPLFGTAFGFYLIDIVCLAFWTILVTLIVTLTAKKIQLV